MQKQYPIEGKVREMLMMWEDKEDSKAPLSNIQKDSYISLTTHDLDDLPEGVFNLVELCWHRNWDKKNYWNFFSKLS